MRHWLLIGFMVLTLPLWLGGVIILLPFVFALDYLSPVIFRRKKTYERE